MARSKAQKRARRAEKRATRTTLCKHPPAQACNSSCHPAVRNLIGNLIREGERMGLYDVPEFPLTPTR